MKKIIIVMHALELGGAERSLIGLLHAVDPKYYDVDLFLMRHEGELLNFVPDYVNLLPEIPAYTVLARPMKDTLKERHFLLTAARLFGKIKADLYNRRHKYTDSAVAIDYSHKYTWRFMPRIQPEMEYDLAISYLTPHYMVAKRVKAKKKVAWIHTDYTRLPIDKTSEYKMWSAYDYILSISESVTEGFSQVFPRMRDRIILAENILPEALIRKQSVAFDVSDEIAVDGTVRFLSVGRYCYAKNFDNIPEICMLLVKQGINVKWYIIGFGSDEGLLRENIEKFHAENRVFLLGKKDNPYPYIRECDVYIQPSRYEGKCVAVREAQMLGKPVIITNYTTASSQLKDGFDGFVVPMENKDCADAIADLIRDKNRLHVAAKNVQTQDYSNAQEIKKLYALMEG